MTELRFDGRVVIITGAGGGLGRSHALLLASRGAHVLVNDLGGALDGSGSSASAAQRVVDEITALGGSAVANHDSVATAEGGEAIVQAAIDAFGRVDILVNNAGILRDKAFHKMDAAFIDAVVDVHLKGALFVSRPAFALMRAQGYGRIVNTSSASGLFGNFGQANYGAAKAGIAAAPERACATADAAVAAAEAFGFPVVLKILSPDILHKSEIGGVLLDVTDAAEVQDGFELLLERAAKAAPTARIEGVLVAKQVMGGVECILGIHRDPVFGPVAMFGLGGIFVEVLKDVVFRRCPFGEDVAEQMIRSIKGAPLLLGARGRKPADVKALATTLARLSVFAHQAGPELQSVDLNPVFAMPEGEGAFAADAVIEIGGPAG